MYSAMITSLRKSAGFITLSNAMVSAGTFTRDRLCELLIGGSVLNKRLVLYHRISPAKKE